MSMRAVGRAPRFRQALPLDVLRRERDIALGNALALSSHLSYDTALRSWAQFAVLHGYPGIPTADSLSLYIIWMSRFVSPRTVDSYLSGIVNKLRPICPDIRSIRLDFLVVNTLRGSKRGRNAPIRRKRALSEQDLEFAVLELATPSFDDVLFLTLLTTGFYSLQRLGELVNSDNSKLVDDRRIPRRHTVLIRPSHFEYTVLPANKADPFFEGNRIVVQRLSTTFDPYQLFLRYIRARDLLFPFNPFLYLTASGSVPSRNFFISRLRALFPDSDISGHSLRSGGATALALAGVPFHQIQAVGRWSSDAFQAYIRENPILAHSQALGRPLFEHPLPGFPARVSSSASVAPVGPRPSSHLPPAPSTLPSARGQHARVPG
jgi:hypothetical protein